MINFRTAVQQWLLDRVNSHTALYHCSVQSWTPAYSKNMVFVFLRILNLWVRSRFNFIFLRFLFLDCRLLADVLETNGSVWWYVRRFVCRSTVIYSCHLDKPKKVIALQSRMLGMLPPEFTYSHRNSSIKIMFMTKKVINKINLY